ncbi:histone-binding protein RBBP4 [Angomonas deanei]|uniref:Histone-binding protein RBBP4 or subunit C of CAF1 complex/WD domain, G-beta repeat, putative n=1 Tax=Angomonas deanei TaxID=59799 RepID=S9X427_9TRYP|nr:histone-binding protein RBBP4 [Angomonas deanei]EPY43190.1 histone-binding protein RBBP4 [Angomonas deanei]CAD2219965.1 Histone-binding protein RBBP4 or subunit C of CAF1 complex/WD domain, G-beta repeat, putative [Angomonas deanei]|eukprot:EPY39131.1 histone-binding protein RBBP4 [Angomonas deanei]
MEVIDEKSCSVTVSGNENYQETKRFCTWRKHTKDLYQQLLHVDLVWESAVAQPMPFITERKHTATHVILSGTRTGGQEQSYLQLLSATLPRSGEALDTKETATCEATGEFGGYGMASQQCGLKIDRRMIHNGDVLCARYMPHNPLLIASTSSDGNGYIFDWSKISLSKFPNDPPRPRAPLPPNELTEKSSDEERIQFQRRMRELSAVVSEQDRWDKRTGEGQHVLTLSGIDGASDNLAWNTQEEGVLASGSLGRVSVWKVGNYSKKDPKTVEPFQQYITENDDDRITNVNFSWAEPHSFVSSCTSGGVYFGDVRSANFTEMFTLNSPAMCLSLSHHDSNSLLVGCENGEVHLYDLRNSSEPVLVEKLHSTEVTCLQWCPHSPHLFASGGKDSNVCIYNNTRKKVLFRHAGHTDNLLDLNWNWQEDCAGQLVSTDSNALMIWRPRDVFFTD